MSTEPPVGFTGDLEPSPTLGSIAAELQNLTRAVAELATRLGHLEVKIEAATASSQRTVNAVLMLQRRVDEIATDSRISAEAARLAQIEAQHAADRATASYEAVRTLTSPMRGRETTQRNSSLPPEE